ncbi:MAG: hypothetical protein ACYDAQ_01685 [Mycobacteriales bacterium]
MRASRWWHVRWALAAALAGGMASAVPGQAATASRPPFIAPECAVQGITGPDTDVNAQAGDGRITVGLNAAGTITVFRYPNPSFYNQVKYYTDTRDAAGNAGGALPNEGSFAGLLYTVHGMTSFVWLRDLPHSQRYLTSQTPVPVTTYRYPALGLVVTDTDLATVAPADGFVRAFTVIRAAGSPVSRASLVYYEKFNPIASKLRYAAGQDNCLTQLNDEQIASYSVSQQAVVHSWVGVDASTGRPSSVALAFGMGDACHRA